MIFYDFDEPRRKTEIEKAFGKGKVVDIITSGRSSDVYVIDMGIDVTPRCVCAKVPKLYKKENKHNRFKAFLKEMEYQRQFFHHQFVHWAIDFKKVSGVPVAFFRWWSGDLDSKITENKLTDISKLSIMVYICYGLMHCYSKGLIAHQDIKPANVFIRNMRESVNVSDALDIHNFALIADFGLANAFKDKGDFRGSPPYMAPEQWDQQTLSSKTDVFALGVVLYQLFSENYHPVGINFQELYPNQTTQEQKNEAKEKLRAWRDSGCKIVDSRLNDATLSQFIERMIAYSQTERPDISEVIDFLKSRIRAESTDNYDQLEFLVQYFDNSAKKDKSWTYVESQFKKLKENFE